MKALIKISTKFRPYSGDIQGYRIVSAIPNLAARKMVRTSGGFRATEEAVPAFGKPYMISESMDYADSSLIKASDMERFKEKLLWQGFTKFEMVTSASQPGKKLAPEVQAKIDAMLTALGFEV